MLSAYSVHSEVIPPNMIDKTSVPLCIVECRDVPSKHSNECDINAPKGSNFFDKKGHPEGWPYSIAV